MAMNDFGNLKDFVPNVIFELIPIKDLVSNQNYQRSLCTTHIAKAAEDFDLYQLNPVKVSRRNGINYVFDGQHTVEIVAYYSGSRETPVWCMVYVELSYEREADIFANQMKYTKKLQPLEVFKANIEAGNEQQILIKQLVESFGLEISSSKKQNCVLAVSTLEEIYTKHGYHILSRVLQLCVATWEGDANSFSSSMLRAIAKLVTVYGDALDDRVFSNRLGNKTPKQIARMARERGSGSIHYAHVMLEEYNGKRKGTARLSARKLYTTKKTFFQPDEDIEDFDESGYEVDDVSGM